MVLSSALVDSILPSTLEDLMSYNAERRAGFLLWSLTLASILKGCFGSGKVTVLLVNYHNSASRVKNGGCCDNAMICVNDCDNYFQLCFGKLSSPDRCGLWKGSTPVMAGGDSFSFPGQGGSLGNGITNPLTYSFTTWQPIKFSVDVWDSDEGAAIGSQSDFVDTYSLSINTTPSPSMTTAPAKSQTLSGKYSQLNVLVKVFCDASYFIPDCSVHCVPRNDSTGHYTCDFTRGRKVCLIGWHGADCLTHCVPRNDSLGHYTCDAIGQRVCLADWYGQGCVTYCQPRNDSQGHYTCNVTGHYICLPGWSGENCADEFVLSPSVDLSFAATSSVVRRTWVPFAPSISEHSVYSAPSSSSQRSAASVAIEGSIGTTILSWKAFPQSSTSTIQNFSSSSQMENKSLVSGSFSSAQPTPQFTPMTTSVMFVTDTQSVTSSKAMTSSAPGILSSSGDILPSTSSSIPSHQNSQEATQWPRSLSHPTSHPLTSSLASTSLSSEQTQSAITISPSTRSSVTVKYQLQSSSILQASPQLRTSSVSSLRQSGTHRGGTVITSGFVVTSLPSGHTLEVISPRVPSSSAHGIISSSGDISPSTSSSTPSCQNSQATQWRRSPSNPTSHPLTSSLASTSLSLEQTQSLITISPSTTNGVTIKYEQQSSSILQASAQLRTSSVSPSLRQSGTHRGGTVMTSGFVVTSPPSGHTREVISPRVPSPSVSQTLSVVFSCTSDKEITVTPTTEPDETLVHSGVIVQFQEKEDHKLNVPQIIGTIKSVVAEKLNHICIQRKEACNLSEEDKLTGSTWFCPREVQVEVYDVEGEGLSIKVTTTLPPPLKGTIPAQTLLEILNNIRDYTETVTRTKITCVRIDDPTLPRSHGDTDQLSLSSTREPASPLPYVLGIAGAGMVLIIALFILRAKRAHKSKVDPFADEELCHSPDSHADTIILLARTKGGNEGELHLTDTDDRFIEQPPGAVDEDL